MMPSDALARAAEALDARVADFRTEALTNAYWQGCTFTQGVHNAMGGAGGRLAGTFTPEAAELLAKVLRGHINDHSVYPCDWAGDCPAVELAQVILAETGQAS